MTQEIKIILEKIQQNKIDEALEELLSLSKNHPTDLNVLNLIGQIYIQKKKYEDAIIYFDKGLLLQNDFPDFLFNKGIACNFLDKILEAEAVFQKLANLNLSISEVFYNLALVKKKLNKYEEAILNFEKAIKINPSDYQSLYNLANCYKDKKNYDIAILNYKKSLSIKKDYAKSLLNLGICYYDKLEINEAINCFNQALQINSEDDYVKYNKSLALLKQGNFIEGWKYYESRWNIDDPKFKKFNTKKNKFKNENSLRLLILSEQGLGDEIMFISILKDLKNYENNIIVRCDERLVDLFSRSFQDIRFISDKNIISDKWFDEYISVGSLFQFFKKNKTDFKKEKYLIPLKNESIENQFQEIKKNKKTTVGLSWKSNNVDYGKIRSIDLKAIMGNINCENYNFINLQYGDVDNEINYVENTFGIKIHTVTDNMQNIDELATVIYNCDKIVSIDNTTIHLAGALGKKCILLLPFSSDWRWIKKENHSYWYKNVEILSQTHENEWSSVLKELKYNLNL